MALPNNELDRQLNSHGDIERLLDLLNIPQMAGLSSQPGGS